VSRYEDPYQPTSSRELKTVVIVGIAVATIDYQLLYISTHIEKAHR
jgi:hypothetical protein